MLKKYWALNDSADDGDVLLEQMTEEYHRMMAASSPDIDSLNPHLFEPVKIYYRNIKTFTYKLGCPEVGKYRFIDLHFCRFQSAEISKSKR